MNVIGVDWGSTHRRAYWLDADGNLLDRRDDGDGVLGGASGGFAARLERLVGDWRRAGPARVWLSGMVGSRSGWQEAPYLPVPASLTALAASALTLPEDADVRIVPGICTRQPGGGEDVMRGEETQLLGAYASSGREGCYLLPGTHSKWVYLRGGRVQCLRTFMTGELFHLLRQQGALAALMQAGAPDPLDPAAREAFDQGLAWAGSGDPLAQLFRIRAQALLRPATEVLPAAALLSGLLIGGEFAVARAKDLPAGEPLQLIGSPALAAWYRRAAAAFGYAVQSLDADLCFRHALLALEHHHA